MRVTSMTGNTTVCQSFVTGEQVRTHYLLVGRYCLLLCLYKCLIDDQGSMRTAEYLLNVSMQLHSKF